MNLFYDTRLFIYKSPDYSLRMKSPPEEYNPFKTKYLQCLTYCVPERNFWKTRKETFYFRVRQSTTGSEKF